VVSRIPSDSLESSLSSPWLLALAMEGPWISALRLGEGNQRSEPKDVAAAPPESVGQGLRSCTVMTSVPRLHDVFCRFSVEDLRSYRYHFLDGSKSNVTDLELKHSLPYECAATR
jgi:hypothetical protein